MIWDWKNAAGDCASDGILSGKTEQKAAGNEGGGSELPLPSLIVCPASLVYNWGQEFARFSPEIRVLLIAGTAKERQEQLEEQMRMEASERAQVIITSSDLLKRDRAAYLWDARLNMRLLTRRRSLKMQRHRERRR